MSLATVPEAAAGSESQLQRQARAFPGKIRPDKTTELTNKHKRSENCALFTITKVNQPIWVNLIGDTRTMSLQTIILAALTPLARLAEQLMKGPLEGAEAIRNGFRLLTDAKALFSAANIDNNGGKLVQMKGEVNSNCRPQIKLISHLIKLDDGAQFASCYAWRVVL
ncbi:hypothetical protein LOTGIDRAFT_166626 [Lottia gigantea]|uniref:Uncharacterized protein n=1 Tax=Lottia gigantea TaxID=225164 RepID=V3Z998_LOTGI|nr:hypothetical protein LOTGIDRAFT_166626 [Lottia gigantea]ESO87473.1 hypothetical protein LOTGIDRAFT_166626 [Lottia gigantea]